MNTFSEKTMEDAIVNNPEKFINEEGLRLLARQYRVGSYIFDLLFEDRHGGKLIVEIQKGTLYRTHTYKILDYYHEYKEENPRDFIDVMVIANIIPPERKRRLNDLGVDYKEVSESIFITDQSEISSKICENESVSVVIQDSKIAKMTTKRRYFESKEPSTFIKMLREKLLEEANSDWDISRGDSSLTAKHKPTIDKLNNEFDTQIWMERPKKRPNGNPYARCKFEVAGNPEKMDSRIEKALSLRKSFMAKGLPKEFEAATGSTVIARRINLSENPTDGHDMNIILDKNEILKIIEFYRFIDEKLNEWNYSY